MKRFWAAIVSVFFLLYMGLQIYFALTAPIVAERALIYSTYDSVSANGFFIREESVLEAPYEGVLDYHYEDGVRVAKNAVVATIYSSQADVELKQQIKELRSYAALLEEAQSPTGLVVSDPVSIERNVDALTLSMIYGGWQNKDLELDGYRAGINMLVNRRRFVSGQVDSFSSEIVSLKEKANALEGRMGSKTTDIKTNFSGFFCSGVDGYERVLVPSVVKSLNYADLEIIASMQGDAQPVGENPPNMVGKIITDFEWYFSAAVNEETAKMLDGIKSVTLNFPFSLGNGIPVQLYHISEPQDKKCVVTFKSNYVMSEMPRLRRQTVDIIFREYSGLRIPNSALRIVDGVEGVYVLKGIQAQFKPINVIYAKDNYKLVEFNPMGGSGSLLIDDEVIVKGKDLYNGKIVK